MNITYKGTKNIEEVIGYFVHITNAHKSVVHSFLRFLDTRLMTLEIMDLQDLYYNYTMTKSKFSSSEHQFLVNVFGNYHLGSGCTLLYVLDSIENNDVHYNEFKKKHFKNKIEKINEELNCIKDETSKLDVGSEKYQNNLEYEIHLLNKKKKLIEEHHDKLKGEFDKDLQKIGIDGKYRPIYE